MTINFIAGIAPRLSRKEGVFTMSFMRDFFGGFVDGIVSGAANHVINGRSGDYGRIEQLCAELGWSVDERDGNAIKLHFRSGKVRISNGNKTLVGFSTHSNAVLPVDRVPADLLAYLLHRNLDDCGMGMWGISVDDDDDDVTFHLYYVALGNGLDAEIFKYICESLIKEVADFDAKLRKGGLLD
jgi:hypothetical protein